MKKLHILTDANEYIDSIPPGESAKIFAELTFLQMDRTEGLSIKPLKGKIKELITKQHRTVFFEDRSTIYVVDAFKKQSKKTPQRIIERAEEIYRYVIRRFP